MYRRPSSAWPILMTVGLAALLASACANEVTPTASTPTGPSPVASTNLASAVASISDGTSTLAATGASKVDVCHSEGNGGFHLISVSANALDAHRQHGDGLVGDPVPAQPGKIFGPACSVVDASCEYSMIPVTRTVTEACSLTTGTAFVTATAGCSWSAVSDTGPVGWLRVISGGGPRVGTGAPQAVTYSTASNRHQDQRTGVITVLDAAATPTSATLTITQRSGHQCP